MHVCNKIYVRLYTLLYHHKIVKANIVSKVTHASCMPQLIYI